jgi:hypothetical protein
MPSEIKPLSQPEKQERSMREIVLEEMEEFRADFPKRHSYMDPKRWRAFFFNNFFLNILGFNEDRFREQGMLDEDPTLCRFFDDVKIIMADLGLNKEELKKIWKRCDENENFDQFLDAVFDLYIRLREEGYSHYDLTT